MKLVLTQDEAALHAEVGTAAFLRARTLAAQGEVGDLRWQADAGLAYGRVRGAAPGSAAVVMRPDAAGLLTLVDGTCSCAQQPDCGHPAALAMLVLAAESRSSRAQEPSGAQERPSDGDSGDARPRAGGAVVPRQAAPAPTRKPRAARPPAWAAAVAGLIGSPAPAGATSEPPGIGLQFELVEVDARRRGMPPWRVGLRPVVPGRTGWVRTGISWSTMSYAFHGRGEQAKLHRMLLDEILAMGAGTDARAYYGYRQQSLYLDEFPSRRIWDVLAEAQDSGLPMVQAGKGAGPVTVSRAPARAVLQADRVDGDLVLTPTLVADSVPVAAEHCVLIGEPAHGVVWWAARGESEPPTRSRVLRLTPLPGGSVAGALGAPVIRIPQRDERQFRQDYYPGLLRRFEIVADETVDLPAVGPAVLTLTVDRLPRHRLHLAWHWVQSVGEDRHAEPLDAPAPTGEAGRRDVLVEQVTGLLARHVPTLLSAEPNGAVRPMPTATVDGDAVIDVLKEVVPRLTGLDGVAVAVRADGDAPEYREVDEAPAISFVNTDTVAQRDWFDLSVSVGIGGQDVPFDELFVALAQDRQYLILPGGAYFTLDRPEFRQLRDLIAEARELVDSPPGMVRVGRFQAGMWQDLAELGELSGQARAWQEAVRALTETGDTRERPVPAGLHAELRPYQRDGFCWLAALYENGLGGILADDMGLGKTVQTLALICHVRARGGAGAPFLVVAPASVVPNWVTEARRFTPDLDVRAVTRTKARRGDELAAAVAGADVVVTSYTLFRLEHEAYASLKWDGLILDEAQFVKNAKAQAHRCARQLTAPFKLAITGTPMENNLAELWALCAITAPGLFPRLDTFTDYYRTPIEREHDTDRLALLRRRIRPLMLRRRKSDVDVDLPDKQEQVMELELDRRHRKVYQTYLQRERQKVLGLLGDLDGNRFEIFRSLTLLRQASLDVSLVDPQHAGVPSTKLDVLAEQVADLVAEGHRTLVFSQFTRFLEAARTRLEGAGVQCCYLDGKTRDRAAVLDDFKNGTAPVFLISLKAGGFGLNLTEADYCIILDPWWNPAAEAQAVDRVHRIGQTRHVMVYRMVAKDTIEEKVLALQRRKAELFRSVLDGGDFVSAALTAADIQALLG